MRLQLLSFAGLLLLIAVPSARADDAMMPIPLTNAAYSDAYRLCLEAGLSQAETQECRAKEEKLWDDRLNAAYKGLMGADGLSAKDKAGLKAAQKAWITDRELSCELLYIAAGEGSMGAGWAADCQVKMTALRAEKLEDWLLGLGK